MSDKQYHDFFSLYVVVVFFPKDYSGSGKEASPEPDLERIRLADVRD